MREDTEKDGDDDRPRSSLRSPFSQRLLYLKLTMAS
jgi:hypothetical protein